MSDTHRWKDRDGTGRILRTRRRHKHAGLDCWYHHVPRSFVRKKFIRPERRFETRLNRRVIVDGDVDAIDYPIHGRSRAKANWW